MKIKSAYFKPEMEQMSVAGEENILSASARNTDAPNMYNDADLSVTF